MSAWRSFAVVMGFLLCTTASALAQTSRGTVTGTVTDPSGAVVPDALVTLKQREISAVRETKSNREGIYRFDALDLGLYSISVKASGFKEEVANDVVIQANRIATFDFQLRLGIGTSVVQVEATASEILQRSEPLRGGNFEPRRIGSLPLGGLDSLNLALLLPGVQNATTTQFSNGSNNYSINGQRARGNSFMIDGVENNDISVAGPAFQITNNDALQEVSVQTSNFSAEYGRAGGAVFNQITKSGTNALHGSVADIYRSNAFDATSNDQRRGGISKVPRRVQNIPMFSVGGPVVIPHLYDGRNKTFFFGAGQWDRTFRTSTTPVRVPTAAGIAVLQALPSTCPNAQLYLTVLGGLQGDPSSSPSNISIAAPSAATSCTAATRTGQVVQTGLVSRKASRASLDNNQQIRIDHRASNKQTLSFRWLYDRNSDGPFFNNLNGFDRGFDGVTLSMAFNDTYIINNHWTNEFRFNYGRIGFDFPGRPSDAFHASLANYDIAGVTRFGLATNIPQFRFANNWQYQDTMSIVRGRHTVRFGVDFLRQLARQHPPFNERGSFAYRAGGGATALANFIDDVGGVGGSLNRQFGDSVYHPNLFRQAYFVQDSWKTSPDLTLDLGLRYENYGQPANIFRTPAFTNYDPVNFAAPNRVNVANHNFGPSVGFAWSPTRLSADRKTVLRGGYQISYDSYFNNILSNIAGSSPNTLGGTINSVAGSGPRGLANFSAQFGSIQPTTPTALSPQTSLLDPNIRNPYTQRFSLCIQHEFPSNILMDISYVGSLGRHLFQTLDVNPIVGTGSSGNPIRFVNAVGERTIRASTAISSYHSLQANVLRRFSATRVGQLQFEGSYTWSHYTDTISEIFASDSTGTSFQSVPQVLGFSSLIDHADSDNDRRHRFVLSYIWDVPGPKSGLLGHTIGGWSFAGVNTLITGSPFNLLNGTDRNSDGRLSDRPDIGNPNALLTTRGLIEASCASGYKDGNLATISCVTPNDVRWLEGAGNPISRTVGRNTLRGPGFASWDLAVSKTFRLTERAQLQYRLDVINLLNTENFTTGNTIAPGPNGTGLTVNGAASSDFVNFLQTDAPGRLMRMQLRLTF